jgi:hypothetical protein
MCDVVLGTGGLECCLAVRTGGLQLECGMDDESQANGQQKKVERQGFSRCRRYR